MALTFTTDSVPDHDRGAYWGAAMSTAFMPLSVVPRCRGSFSGRLTTRRLGYLQVSTLSADAKRLSRTRHHIEESPARSVGLCVQISGSVGATQDGRHARVGSGELLFYDGTRPYALDYPGPFEAHVVQFPREVLNVPDDQLRRVTGTAIPPTGGVALLLAPLLCTLATSPPGPCAPVGDRLAGGVTELVATLVAELAELAEREDGPGRDTSGRVLAARARQFINENLGDPSLSPETIAAAHHISVRYLHRLFADQGVTVGRHVLRRRLEECRRELARGGAHSTVSAVAHRWGFVNAAHFSRTFKAAYGVSPRAWRDGRPGG